MGVERDIKTGELTHVYGDAGNRGPKKPEHYLGTVNSLWSNIDGVLDLEVEERLKMGDCCALHAAWDYAGYVWFEPTSGVWYEEIWQRKSLIVTLSGDSATNVIAQAIAGYGVR